eukprot:jgi/Picre1/30266/NNA_005632.t1
MQSSFLFCILAIAFAMLSRKAFGDLRSGDEVFPQFNGTTTEELVDYMKRRNLLLANGRRVEELPAWRARMNPKFGKSYLAPALTANICRKGKTCETSLGRYPYDRYLKDPTGRSQEPVLKIGYPKGSWSPGSPKPGGLLFFAYPYKKNTLTKDNPFSVQGATLEYDVYFDPNFDFVKGGKLPGLAGGRSNGRGCGGGNDPDVCFSIRIMWRRQGNGEVYIYAPEGKQGKNFCSKYNRCDGKNFPCTVCNYKKGVSFGRGTFQFKKGVWQKLTLSIVLNDKNRANGYVELKVDGKTVISYDKMRWRTYDKVKVEAINFASFFGGSDASWSPPRDTYTLIRDMKAYRTGPATYSRESSRVAPLSEDMGVMESTVSYEEIQEPEEEYEEEY